MKRRALLAPLLGVAGVACVVCACSGLLGIADQVDYLDAAGAEAAGPDARGLDATVDATTRADGAADAGSSPDAPGADCGAENPHACGATLKDCLGGCCSNGACTPFLLQSNTHAVAIAAGAAQVNWIDDSSGQVWGCSSTGANCGALVAATPLAESIATSGQTFAYAAPGEVFVYRSPGPTLVLSYPLSSIAGVALDDTYLYVNDPSFPAVDRVLLADASAGVEGAALTGTALALAPYQGSLYVLEADGVYFADFANAGSALVVPQGLRQDAGDLGVTSGGFVWTTEQGLLFAPSDGGSSAPISQVPCYGLAVDEAGAYYYGDAGVLFCDLPACANPGTIDTVNVPAGVPGQIAVSPTSVFWIDATGQVWQSVR